MARTKTFLFAFACSALVGCANHAHEDGKKLPIELAQMAKNGELPYAQKKGGEAAGPAVDPVEAAREQSLKEPYANDLGPETVNVSGYPAQAKAGYEAFKLKCTQCHSAARPLNAQFIDGEGSNADKWVAHYEKGVWKRFTKRMMAKPGCEITKEEARDIVFFLVHDSNARKRSAAWRAQRKKMLSDFKKKHPKRYALLYGG
jgi:hypothetical protein